MIRRALMDKGKKPGDAVFAAELVGIKVRS